MELTEQHHYEPEILGISWIPGELILVGARPGCGRTNYILGNCIVEGTKGNIPIAYFAPGGNPSNITKRIMGMVVGKPAVNDGSFLLWEMPEYPLYIDCTPHLEIEYLVGRIFHLVKEHAVKMVVIDCLQKVDGSNFSACTKEQEMKSILRILKGIAAALGLVIIVSSQISENVQWANQTPQVTDILYVPLAEELCDQIVLIKPMAVLEDAYQLILPKGFAIFDGEYGEVALNVVMDKDTGYFKKAEKLFVEDYDNTTEEPMYEWFMRESDSFWHFGFFDSSGKGWEITISPSAESENNEYDIDADSWDGSHISIAQCEPGEDMEKLKAFALREARRRFPAVEIPEKG